MGKDKTVLLQQIAAENNRQNILEKDTEFLSTLIEENGKAAARINQGAHDNLDYTALGYTLHNIYCLMENYFLRIAKFFENNLDPITWHKDLIRRMTIDIQNVRPAVLDDATAGLIDKLRSFRHVFRNMYQSKLKADRVMQVNENIPSIIDGFTNVHIVLIKNVRIIQNSLNS